MLYMLLINLSIVFAILFSIYFALWIGQPSEATCQKVNSIRIDCILKYQALLRSSEQEIKDVQGIAIDEHISSSDGENQTKYVASLRSRSGIYPIKTYSIRNDPGLEILNHHFNKFIENPEEKLFVSLQYNRWQPVIDFLCGFLYIVCFFSLPCAFLLVVQLINWVSSNWYHHFSTSKEINVENF